MATRSADTVADVTIPSVLERFDPARNGCWPE
jgi:hypothetical protein